jgi:hypothetical protein
MSVGSASGDSVERPQHHELALKEGMDRISPLDEGRREEVGQHQEQHRALFNMWNVLFMCTSGHFADRSLFTPPHFSTYLTA